ncbi:MAG TPA: hypothetical protein PLK90_02475 [Clostridiales bacterium]|jgi:hypothetical protein|nr:hypothetical protein [Clostridiales bacterium]HQP69243.1 hypothetical protein [Clostridiales bacterium]
MKKFPKDQIIVMVVSFLAIVFLAFQVVSIDPSMGKEELITKYKSSVDSVVIADSLIRQFVQAAAINSKDIYNLKSVKIKKQVQETESTDSVKTVVQKTKWVSSFKLYGRDKIAYSFYFNGKAKFSINGRTQEVKVGDVITVGESFLKEVIESTNEPTGKTKPGKEYSNKVIAINERAVYVDSEDKKNVIRFKPNSDATLFNRGLMDTSSGEEKESGSEKTDTPGGRRPARGGR